MGKPDSSHCCRFAVPLIVSNAVFIVGAFLINFSGQATINEVRTRTVRLPGGPKRGHHTRQDPMLRFALSLRYLMLVASLGAALGAMLMFWGGGAKMIGAARSLASGADSRMINTSIMHGTDAFLFGIMLVIFAYAIAFGFVLDLSSESREGLPSWMRVSSLSELKDTLVQVILVTPARGLCDRLGGKRRRAVVADAR